MQPSNHTSLRPEAFRGFLEGVQNLQNYLRTNQSSSLQAAEQQFDISLEFAPDFAPARYYKAIALTHARKADDAISLLEGLRRDDPRFKSEVLYNLAFAYARKYKDELFEKSLALLDEAYKSAHHTFLGVPVSAKRLDLVLLIKAMRAWVMAVFGGRPVGRKDDFPERRIKFLPRAERLARSVLKDRRLNKLEPEARTAVQVDAHNAAGIAYMRMGQYAKQFKGGAEYYWQLSEHHYLAALELHPHDVRVLDNLSTLHLIRAARARRLGQEAEAIALASVAKNFEREAISFNPHDRFRWLTLARACALIGEWDEAAEAAYQIPRTPGVMSDEDADRLKDAIHSRDVDYILKSYPTEE